MCYVIYLHSHSNMPSAVIPKLPSIQRLSCLPTAFPVEGCTLLPVSPVLPIPLETDPDNTAVLVPTTTAESSEARDTRDPDAVITPPGVKV